MTATISSTVGDHDVLLWTTNDYPPSSRVIANNWTEIIELHERPRATRRGERAQTNRRERFRVRREGAVHGNPYIRVLRRQLEAYITEELGDEYLRRWQEKTERREITREMAELRKRLDELEARRAQIEGRD